MAFPTNWPPRVATNQRSIRFYVTGTATALFSDNGYLFIDGVGANTYTPLPVIAPGSNASVVVPNNAGTGVVVGGQPVGGSPPAMIWSGTILINNASAAALEFSFDGTNVHGRLLANTSVVYRNRFESGIAVRGLGTFWVEAW